MKRPVIYGNNTKTKKRKGLGDLVTFPDICHALDILNLQADQLAFLATKISKLYASKAHFIVKNFPNELWTKIIQSPKFMISELLPLRTVCRSWNKVLCAFAKVNTKGYVHDPSKLQPIFTSLRSLNVYQAPIINDWSMWTSLRELKVVDPDSRMTHQVAKNLIQLWPLTNLSKLTLEAPHVTSLGKLTSLDCLYLKGPRVGLKRPAIDNLPHLTRLISTRASALAGGRGLLKNRNVKGLSLEGEFNDAGRLHGESVVIFSDGARQEGSFREGKPEGQIKIYSPTGMLQFEGEYQQGSRNGYGVATPAPEKIFKGNFRDGLPDGEGWCQINGETYTGYFEHSEGKLYVTPPGGDKMVLGKHFTAPMKIIFSTNKALQ